MKTRTSDGTLLHTRTVSASPTADKIGPPVHSARETRYRGASAHRAKNIRQWLRRVYIPKDAKRKKLRPLGIPAVRDRIAQEVVRRLLEPIFEPLFHDNSFGFRPGRSCHQAVERVLEYHRQGFRVTLDADIAGFFDQIPHRVIAKALAHEVADGNILRLVEKFKAKIRELTKRHHNLDAKVVEKLNQVIRGTANYFATGFSTCLRHFLALDKWIRRRVRCMKLKRKSCRDNYKLRMVYFQKLGMLKLSDFAREAMCKHVA